MTEFCGFTEQELLDEVRAGRSLAEIADALGESRTALWKWLESDKERSAHAREAREASAAAWDDKAASVIEDAADPFELSKAKELAHHYRWRASKISPREYGEKIQAQVTTMTLAELMAQQGGS